MKMLRKLSAVLLFAALTLAVLAAANFLLVDDVLTTGATVTACADAFACVEELGISVMTLAKAAI